MARYFSDQMDCMKESFLAAHCVGVHENRSYIMQCRSMCRTYEFSLIDQIFLISNPTGRTAPVCDEGGGGGGGG